MITEKSVNIQIIGTLMKNPLLLSDTKYTITPEDFSTSFERQIFGAIYNLFLNGVETITVIDIDNYLQNYEGIYQNFIKANGIEYLQDCEEISNELSFDYYYNKLKKYNLLNDLKADGFDISNLYPQDIMDKDYNKKMDNFEEMSTKDIFDKVKLKLSGLEAKYECKGDIKKIKASDGIRELLENLKANPDVGAPLQGKIYNTAVRGARLGKYYIRSADSGVGKTRSMIGDACGLAYPFRFNQENMRWEYSGCCEKVLYLGTEQEPEEIQTIILAYLTGINEERILCPFAWSNEERQIINKALELMDKFSDNFVIDQMPDPSIKSVKAKIRQEVLVEGFNYVFYDYIFSSPALMGELGGLKLREDVILMMMSTALKDLAVELNIFLQSATQVTVNEAERDKMKTKASIRGAKSIADKADVGVIISLVTENDLKVLAEAIDLIGETPNQVTDIYKLRRGKYNNVRIWSKYDAGTCRKKDLFITDSRMNQVTGFQSLDIQLDLENIGELDKILNELNNFEEQEELKQINNNIIVNTNTGEVIEESKDSIVEEESKEEPSKNQTIDWSKLY